MLIAAFVTAHRDEILDDWRVEAQRLAATASTPAPVLASVIARFIDELARVLASEDGVAERLANECAAELLESTAPVSRLVGELGLLRRCVLRAWRAQQPGGFHEEAASTAARIDAVIERAVERHLELRTSLLDAYERIALATMRAPDLATFLRELLLVLAALPLAPDSLAIYLREGDHLELRASIGPRRAELATATAQELATLAGWQAVSLVEGGELVGVVLAATGDDASPEQRIFRLTARRATTTIVQYHRRAEASRRAAELETFIEAIQSPVYIGDGACFTNANTAGLELLGVAGVEELRRLRVADLVERLQLRDPNSGELVSVGDSVFARALAGERLAVDCYSRCASRSEAYYRCVAGPVLVDGKLAGTVVVLSDVTAIKGAEARFRTMFERIPMGIAQSDPVTGKVVRANAKMCELTGYSLDELIGRSFLEWTHPDDRSANLDQYRAMVRGDLDVYTTEKRYVRKDGDVAWVRVTAGLLPSPGEPPRTLATIEDVTARHEAELEREQLLAREQAARAELDRAAEFRERFLAIVSHDLRNPLNAIVLTALHLTMAPDVPDSFAPALERIRASGMRMGQMIGELLDLTRGRLGGGIPIEPKRADLLAIVRTAVDELELAYPSRRIALTAAGRFDGVWDVERLAQVASNLIGNALQHSPKDSEVRLQLVDRGGDGVALRVTNRGAPIPEALLPHLFEPFRHGDHSTHGLGLGLYIASEVVRAHGGTLDVTSTSDDGTTFTVVLPRGADVGACGCNRL